MRNSFSQFGENGQQERKKKNLASPSVTILRMKIKMLQHLILLLLGSTALVLAQVPPVPVSNCFSSGYFRHPLDCSKFYRCVETLQSPLLPPGTPIRFSIFNFDCPAGTVFDERIQVEIPPHKKKQRKSIFTFF